MPDPPTAPIRREPPPFRLVEVVRTSQRSPHLRRVTLAGDELAGFDPGSPAASCRLLLPDADGTVELPKWRGNEFLRSDGRRPRIRTLTPLRYDAASTELDVEVVLHDASPLTAWATSARSGDPVAVSGSGAGYDIEPDATAFVLAGDESALPAITTLLPSLPPAAEVTVLVEVREPSAAIDLPAHPRAIVTWCELAPGDAPGTALFDAAAATRLDDDARVWAAGEAAAMQRLRVYFGRLDVPRHRMHVRGYWKHGREGT